VGKKSENWHPEGSHTDNTIALKVPQENIPMKANLTQLIIKIPISKHQKSVISVWEVSMDINEETLY